VILLDTNVISEVMRPAPAAVVVGWLNLQDASRLALSTVSVAEIYYGLRCLSDGQRRRLLSERFDQLLRQGFAYRILDFDQSAALAYGELMASCRAIGRPMSVLDAQIAAIAKCQGFALATRNISDFEHTGLQLIDPWVALAP
jgi:toxin FitB